MLGFIACHFVILNTMPKQPLSTHQKRLFWFGILSLAIWVIPETRPVLYPLIYLNTHLHELCHALSAWATGGTPLRIEVYASGSGITPVRGGNILIVASAGYVGAAVIGGLLLFASGNGKNARTALYSLGFFLSFSLLFLVRGDSIGLLSAFLWIVTLLFIARKGKQEHQQNLVAFLGMQQCFTSSYSLLILQKLTVANDLQNDAGIMQEMTRIPALFWAISWSIIGLAAMWIGLRQSARSK